MILFLLVVFIWLIILFLFLRLTIHSLTDISQTYLPSEFYVADNFPMRIKYKTNGYIINNMVDTIQYVVNHINESLDYEVFTFDQQNTRALVVTIQNSTYYHYCNNSFDGYSGILAHATLPPNRLVCIDASENWDQRQDNHRLLKRVLLHELGHILGLRHAFNSNSIMSYRNVQTFQPYDIECLKKIYPFMAKD